MNQPHTDPLGTAEYESEDGFGTDAPEEAVWSCKIGWANRSDLPAGADGPLRQAVEIAFYNLTGKDPEFTFSGWGAELTAAERGVLNDGDAARPERVALVGEHWYVWFAPTYHGRPYRWTVIIVEA